MMQQRMVCRKCREVLGVATWTGDAWEFDTFQAALHSAMHPECKIDVMGNGDGLGVDMLPLPPAENAPPLN